MANLWEEQLAVYISDRVPEMLIGDPGRFRQIITNLMGNSIKVSAIGSKMLWNMIDKLLGEIKSQILVSTTVWDIHKRKKRLGGGE